jgi:purine-binding chemotaxis protein CheW
MKGLIDLRGRGVPVMDLRLRFGMAETELTRDTAIVVIELDAGEGRTVVGLLADAVHEVVEIRPERIEKAPLFGTGPAADFLRAVGRMEEAFVLILDIDRIFDAGDPDLAAELALGEA